MQNLRPFAPSFFKQGANGDVREYNWKAWKRPEPKKLKPPTYIWTSPYGSCWPANCFEKAGAVKYKSAKIVKEADMSFASGKLPGLLIMGNFVVDRHAIRSKALSMGIDVIHGEDGFFPHYQTLHVDPLGFCWESSLSRMTFRDTVTDLHRTAALKAIEDAQGKEYKAKKPYVLFPMQLIGDKVNQYGLNVRDNWLDILKHARSTLPNEITLIVKKHPRNGKVTKEEKWALENTNTEIAPVGADVYELIRGSQGVMGVNSTVLTEARLLYNKPVWCYGESWYNGHSELFNRIDSRFGHRAMSNEETLEKGIASDSERLEDYRLWYTGQLLSRQYTQKVQVDPESYKKWLFKRTYKSWVTHGESIFDRIGITR